MSNASITHGMSSTQEYRIWSWIKDRCFNPNHKSYKNYGAKGIVMCQEWENDFIAFYQHIGPRPSKEHSVGRINNTIGYFPGNIRWETRDEQSRNRALQITNRSGISGVCIRERVSDKGSVYRYLIASVNIPYELSSSNKEVKVQKYFSINKYGEETATQMAVEWRKEKLDWLAAQGVVYAESHGLDKQATRNCPSHSSGQKQ